MFLSLFVSSMLTIFFAKYANASLLAFVGCYGFHCWCFENGQSMIHLVFNIIRMKIFSKKNRSIKDRFGKWAVVTGSTDGIGKEYAKLIASQGINVVLISRSLTKLKEVASQIESMYGVKTKCIVIDFNEGKDVYDQLEMGLRDISKIGILVNCVGRMYEYPDEFGNVPFEVLWSLINMNIGAMLTTTRIVVNRMKKQKKGAIINISSGSELQPVPYATLYAASKVFVRHFTLGLQHELDPYGITVQLITPYCVQTKLHTYPIRAVVGNIFFPPVEVFATSAIFTLGKTNETCGYWPHSIMNGAMRLLPVYMRTIIASRLTMRIRSAYLQKKSDNNSSDC